MSHTTPASNAALSTPSGSGPTGGGTSIVPASTGTSRRFWTVAKWLLCGLVLAFVVRRGWQLWNQPELSQIEFGGMWLLPAGVIYLAGWLPSVWFWRRSMERLGSRVSLRDAAAAYYPGHLGKYVPGKALVLVIRSALLRGRGVPLPVSAFTAALETLLMMGTGLALGVALAPMLFPPEVTVAWPAWAQHLIAMPLLPAGIVVLACVLLLRPASIVLTALANRMLPAGWHRFATNESPGRSRDTAHRHSALSTHHSPAPFDAKLLAGGVAAMLAGWLLMGLSLGCVLQSVGVDWQFRAIPMWTGSVALATSIGFVAVFAPGGMGVREGLLIEVLSRQADVGPQQAVAAAVLLRAVWFVAEILAAGGLYWGHAVYHRARAE